METSGTRVADFLDSMTEQEREELFTYMQYQKQKTGGAQRRTRELSHEQQTVVDAVFAVVGIPRERRQPTANLVQGVGGWQKFSFAADTVNAFVNDSVPAETDRTVRLHVMRACLLLQVEYMRHRRVYDSSQASLRNQPIPVTPVTVLSLAPTTLQYAVEQQFPGYAASRLLDRIAPLLASRFRWNDDEPEESAPPGRRRRVLRQSNNNERSAA